MAGTTDSAWTPRKNSRCIPRLGLRDVRAGLRSLDVPSIGSLPVRPDRRLDVPKAHELGTYKLLQATFQAVLLLGSVHPVSGLQHQVFDVPGVAADRQRDHMIKSVLAGVRGIGARLAQTLHLQAIRA